MQRVEGSGAHRGDLVVVEREEPHRTQPHEAAVTYTADTVTPEHAAHTQTQINKVIN